MRQQSAIFAAAPFLVCAVILGAIGMVWELYEAGRALNVLPVWVPSLITAIGGAVIICIAIDTIRDWTRP